LPQSNAEPGAKNLLPKSRYQSIEISIIFAEKTGEDIAPGAGRNHFTGCGAHVRINLS